MMQKKISVKSPLYKSLVKDKTKAWRELDNSRIREIRPGYVMDQWGTYVPEVLVNRLLDTLSELSNVDSEEDARAARISRAGILLTVNQFDEAEVELTKLAKERPENNAGEISDLVVIAAKRGNFDEAERLASIVNASPHTWFHMSVDRIREEFEKHKRIVESSKLPISKPDSLKNASEANLSKDSKHEELAVEFATTLITGYYEGSEKFLSKSLRKVWPALSLKAAYEEMVGYFESEPNFVDATEELTDWPSRVHGDVGWVYVTISNDSCSEGVAVVVSEENEKLVIRDIEWGRP